MTRDPERLAPLAQRMFRVWASQPKKTFLGLLLEVVKPGEVPEGIDDLELVTRLEKKFKDA